MSYLPRSLFGALLAFLFVGCGQKVKVYPVSGQVTYGGKQIPTGTITFTPTVSKNQPFVLGKANIVNGQFDTRLPDGRVGSAGLCKVRIEGFDGRATPTLPQGKPLFAPYETTVELPTQATQKDFDVKAEEVKPAPPKGVLAS